MKYSRNSFSRFVPILLVIVITIVAVAAVIAIGRSLLGGGQSAEPVEQLDEGRTALLTTDVTRSVRVTVRGPIVADESFRSYRVTISPDARMMTTYEGYLEKQLETKSLDNNARAYEELVYALDKRKMMDGRALSDEQNDLRGICASKKLYEFETLVNGDTVKKLWTSDCDGSKGSALANVSEILDMFLKQVPDGKKMASGVGLAQEEAFFRL
ncbi:hypothetical protein B7Z17_02050 [Candidatus Saccharibacteria bacterium 32-49-10]|nr:MAG: hypothetical protein B7Z17_02050 [Candidatus Saccharibacteria bacterium 32-49-10]